MLLFSVAKGQPLGLSWLCWWKDDVAGEGMRLLLCRISDTEQALVLVFSMTPHGSAGGASQVFWALFSKTGFVTVGAGWGESLQAVLNSQSENGCVLLTAGLLHFS